MSTRALIIDDSRLARTILKRMLTGLGCAVSEAVNAEDALECIERDGLPDVAFVDWNMPGISGPEFVRILRTRPGGESAWVVIATAEDDPARLEQARAAGANEVLVKPFDAAGVACKLPATC